MRSPQQAGSIGKTSVAKLKIEDIRLPRARWEAEDAELDDEGWRRRIAAVVDSPILEATVSGCVAIDLSLTIFTFSFQEAEGSDAIFVLSAFLIVVLFMDVLLRVLREGRKFWARPLNWLEFFVAVVGVSLLTIDGVRSYCAECSNDKGSGRTGASIGRSVRPLMKGCRIFRAFTILATGAGGLSKQSDRIATRMIQQFLRDFCIVPPENISTQPSQGKIHIEKAQVRSQVFDGLHLPFNIDSGILDLFHFKVNLITGIGRRKEESSEGEMKGLVIIENMMLVIAPGHHQERGEPWDFDHVADAKARLIELLTNRMEATAKPKLSSAAVAADAKRATMVAKSAATNLVKRIGRGVVRSALTNGMLVSVRNLEVRYEDCLGDLTRNGGVLVAGIRVDTASMRIRVADHSGTIEGGHDGFRACGRWTTVTEVSAGCQVLPKPPLQSTSSHSSAATALLVGSTTSTKDLNKAIKEGVMLSLHATDVCSFWDMLQGDAAANEDARIGSKLREGSGVDIAGFLLANARSNARERARLALCREVEARLAKESGHKYAAERARKLRDRFAAHTYVILPFRCSVHSILRPIGKWAAKVEHHSVEFDDSEYGSNMISSPLSPSNTDTGSPFRRKTWQPHNDVNVEVAGLCINLDLAQAGSFLYLVDYFKRWFREDRRMRSRPHPRDTYQAPVFMYWSYALSRVLHGIDPNYRWKSLSWIELRLIAFFRSEYFAALSSEAGRSKDRLRALQVPLPLKTALFVRQEGASALATKRFLRKAQAQRNWTAWLPFKETDTSPTDMNWTEDVFLAEGISRSFTAFEFGSKKELRIDVKPAQEALQVCCSVGSASIYLLQPPHSLHAKVNQARKSVESVFSMKPDPTGRNSSVRRQLINIRASGINALIAKMAPRHIWMRMAPPAAAMRIAEADDEVPEGIASEATLDEFHVVWCEAPPNAPHMRRVASCSSKLASSTSNPWCSREHIDTSDGGVEGFSGSSLWMQKRHAARFVVGACAGTAGKAGPESPWHPRYGMKDEEDNDLELSSSRDFVRRAEVAVRLRLACMGLLDKFTRSSSAAHWEFATCVLPVQGHICKPLIQAVMRTLNVARVPGRRRRTTHVVEHHSCEKRSSWASKRQSIGSIGSSLSLSENLFPRSTVFSEWITKEAMSRTTDRHPTTSSWSEGGKAFRRRLTKVFTGTKSTMSLEYKEPTPVPPEPSELKYEHFWDYVLRLRRQLAQRRELNKKERQAEAIIGVSGLFRQSLITGEVFCVGGFQGAVLEPGTRIQWLTRTMKLPPGVVTLERGRQGRAGVTGKKTAALNTSFTPLAANCCPVQAEDGWWYPSKEAMDQAARAQEAGFQSQFRTLESPKSKWERAEDYTVGEDAYELPMREILLTPGREFGFDETCETPQRAAFVWHPGGRGMWRTGLGNSEPAPPMKGSMIQRLNHSCSRLAQSLSQNAQPGKSGAMAAPLLQCTYVVMNTCNVDCKSAGDKGMDNKKIIIDHRQPTPAVCKSAVPPITQLCRKAFEPVARAAISPAEDLSIDIHVEMVHAAATGLPRPLMIQDSWSWAESVRVGDQGHDGTVG